MASYTGLFLITYLIGSIPTAFIYGKIKGKDIRKEGSGNVGATNAGRLFGKKAFFIIFILDFLKGFIPVYFFVPAFIATQGNIELISVIVLFVALMGHVWSIFLKFKGGKGVATSVGGVFAIMPLACFLSLIVFGIIVAIKKMVSLGSMIGALLFPLFCWLLYDSKVYLSFAFILAIFIVFTHRSNIKRLIKGEENKIVK